MKVRQILEGKYVIEEPDELKSIARDTVFTSIGSSRSIASSRISLALLAVPTTRLYLLLQPFNNFFKSGLNII